MTAAAHNPTSDMLSFDAKAAALSSVGEDVGAPVGTSVGVDVAFVGADVTGAGVTGDGVTGAGVVGAEVGVVVGAGVSGTDVSFVSTTMSVKLLHSSVVSIPCRIGISKSPSHVFPSKSGATFVQLNSAQSLVA